MIRFRRNACNPATKIAASRVVFGVAMGLFAGALPAADLYVPTMYPSIQLAINAASNGDTVLITPGTYFENIHLGGKDITIKAFNTNFDTIIDGRQLGPVVTFSGKESSKCVLRDLIIRNGRATNGGGILGNGTLATINKCTIGANTATGDGGGIHGVSGTIKNTDILLNLATNGGGMAACSGFVDNCTITNNKANYAGGGIYGYGGQIQFSEISNNVATVGGGGIAWGTGILYRNTIENNEVTAAGSVEAPESFGGGIVYSMGMMVSNTIRKNASNGDGGGVAFCSDLMWNNIIAENWARRGGGMAYCSGRIENNTIWGNQANSRAGGCLEVGSGVVNCIIYSNTAPSEPQWSGGGVPQYSCVEGWVGTPDVINLPPRLANPANGNFELLPDSPCIDAGRFIADLPNDYRLDPRPMNGSPLPRGDGSDFDIGADEFRPVNMDVAVSFDSVTTTYAGQPGNIVGTVQAKVRLSNIGSENISGTVYVQMYGSPDGILDGADYPVGELISISKLSPGASKTADFKLVLPTNMIVTGYHLIAQADPGYTLGDVNLANNIAVSAPQP